MGYKLADGSGIFDYLVGDTFKCKGFLNEIVYSGFGGFGAVDLEAYMICQNGMSWLLSSLTPTEETKRKVAERSEAANRKMYRDFDEKCKQLSSERKCFSEIMRDLYRLAGVEIDEEKLDEIKRAISQESKCKCGYVIPAMEVSAQPSNAVDFFELNNAIELCLNMQAKMAEGDFSYDGLDEHIDRLLDLQYATLTGAKVVD